jgi:hypothetical protein
MRNKMNILGINMDCLSNKDVHQIQWLDVRQELQVAFFHFGQRELQCLRSVDKRGPTHGRT